MKKIAVLVIGGGVGGVSTIVGLRKLNKKAEIVLVDPKEYCELIWGAYRSPFDSAVAKGSLRPLEPFCKKHNVKHLKKSVVEMKQDQVVLDDGEIIPFTICVVATGATTKWDGLGRGPGANARTVQARLEQLEKEGKRILNAGSVLICGGGLVGVELAGDVAGFAKKAGKDMRVTLVHSGKYLAGNEFDERGGSMLQKQLESNGVRIILNERAKFENNKWLLEKSGEWLQEEDSNNEVIMTVGIESCNNFVQQKNVLLNDQGWVDIDENFRVTGTNGRIFGFGDCCALLPNTAKDIMENINVIGYNVNATLQAIDHGAMDERLVKRLKTLKLGPPIVVATTGPNSGVMHCPWFNTSWFLPRFKNWTMSFFLAKVRLGIKSVG